MSRTLTSCADWDLIRHLGSGQFGKVTLWKNTKSNEKIAIKMCEALESQSSIHSRQAVRWRQEIAQTKEIDHPNIVKYKEIPECILYGFVKDYQALGMEYCDEGDLRSMLSKIDYNCGLPEYLFRDFMKGISDALHYLHRNSIIHRDLKPENIVMKKDAKHNIVFKIIDLGYAKDISGQNHAYSLVGTWHYIAPEFWNQQGNLYHTVKVDFWSFGLVAFECITGRRPFYPFVEPVRVTREIQANKSDSHICTIYSMESGYRFSSTVPHPNWLHESSSEKIVPWLQSMLILDAKKRGGSDWYKELCSVLTETQMIYVFNTQECKMVKFPFGAQNSRRPLKQRLAQLMSVFYDDQLICLFEKGDVPDPRQLIENQCIRHHGPPRVLYVFTTDRPFNVKPIPIPKEISDVSDQQRTQQSGNPLEIFNLIIFYINQQLNQCTDTLKSLSTLNESVKKLSINCRDQGEKLTSRFNEFRGMLRMMVQNVTNECKKCSLNPNDVEGPLRVKCKSHKDDLEKFRLNELPNLCQLVQSAADPVPRINDTLHKNSNFVDTNIEKILERRKSWISVAKPFRAFARPLRDLSEKNKADVDTLIQQAFMRLKDLILQVVLPLNEFASEMLNEAVKSMDFLVQAHRRISFVLFGTDIQIVDESIKVQTEKMLDQQNNRFDCSLDLLRYLHRTHMSLFEELQRFSQIYGNLISRENVRAQRDLNAGVERRAEKLTKEMGLNLQKVSSIVEDMKLNSEDNIMDLDWSFLNGFDDNGFNLNDQNTND